MPLPEAPRRAVIIVGRQRAHEVLFLCVAVITGISYIVGAPRPGSVSSELDPIVFRGWAIAMLVTGVFGLVGCYWRTRIETSLGIERGAMVAQLGALLIYAAAVIAYAGVRGLLVALIVLGWSAANLVRAVQITADLRRLR